MEQPQISGLGGFLRAERERKHITIEQVASATKINVKLLHALENDNYDMLPAKPFVRGFVSSYTRYVGLDPKEVLDRFEGFLSEKSGRKFQRSGDSPHIFVEKETPTDNNKMMLSLVMGLFVVAGLVVFMFKPLKHHKHPKLAKITNEDLVTVPGPAQAVDGGAAVSAPATGESEADAPEKLKEALEGKLPKKEVTAAKPAEKVAEKVTEKPTEPPFKAPAVPLVLAPKIKPVESKPKPPAPAIAKPVVAPAPVVVAAKVEPAAEPEPTPPEAKEEPEVKAAPENAPEVVAAPPKKVKMPPIPDKEVKQLLVVRAREDSWVKYQPDDRPVMEFMLRKDKKIYIRARESIRFKTGNPKGVEISLNHKEFGPYQSSLKTLIIPDSVSTQYESQPFVAPGTPQLSTGTR